MITVVLLNPNLIITMKILESNMPFLSCLTSWPGLFFLFPILLPFNDVLYLELWLA